MSVVFVGAAVAALGAVVPVSTSRVIAAEESRVAAHRHQVARRGLPVMNRALIGALIAAGAFGLIIGVYESCWTLLLEYRDAKSWQIGLSWTLFAVPFVVMSRPAGWLADHFDRRHLAVGGTAVSIGFCALYPFLHHVGLLLALGSVEAVGTAVALPATQSLLAQSSRLEELGRVQGLFSTSETGAIAVSALVAGVLFGKAPWAPFVAGAVAAGTLIAFLPAVWAPVAGRAADVLAPDDRLVVELKVAGKEAPRPS
jgi:DHA1 family multidrug resistance protein-like MFS transporter